MKIFKNKKSLINEISGLKKIAFVPTMGALHKGHISLINKAKKKSNEILVSIYVNPKQFNSKKEFKKYPRKLIQDIRILKKNKINYLYLPTNKDIYSFNPSNKISLDNFSKILCGKFRPHHFKGVLNVVNRFIEIVKPKFIYLGMKDFQQLSLIQSHVNKNNIKTKIISCPTIRLKNGLAISSRNSKLSQNHIICAGKIYRYLKNNKKLIFNKILKGKRSQILDRLITLVLLKLITLNV